MNGSTRLARLLAATLLALCAVPQVALAINKCNPNGNVYVTINLGFVTQNPFKACPTGDPQISPSCTTLTFSGPGAFSIPVGFNYEPECPGELYEVTFTGTFGYTTSVLPKYQVLSVYYAPPGSKSTATYGTNYLQSTDNSFSNTFTVANNVSVEATDILGISGDSATAAYGWSQSSTTSSSLTIATTTSESLVIPGPASSKNGIDHTQDLIYIWLNPALTVDGVGGAVPIQVTSINYDSTDPDQGMDIYPLSVANLKVLAAGGTPTGVDMTRLARAWSPTGALTAADYQSILAADPFATNPNYSPVGQSRYDSLNQTINYTPADSGGNPISTPYTSTETTTSTAGQSATDTHSVEVAVSGQVDASAYVKVDIKGQTTWTWTNTWSILQTSASGQTADFSIVSPLTTDGYTGPTAIGIYKDNVYGTFMFFGEL